MKQCSKCKIEQEDSYFYFDKRRNDYRNPCKICTRKIVLKSNIIWRKNNPDKVRASNKKRKLKTNYNISPLKLQEYWIAQNKCCAICNHPISLNATEKASKPHVDHSHVTGIVRGLLCLTCNTGLGMFGDSLDLLEAARNYLLSRDATTLNASDTTSVTVDSNLISTFVN